MLQRQAKTTKKQAARAYKNLCKTVLNCKPSKSQHKKRRNEIRHQRRVIRARMQEEADRIKRDNEDIAKSQEAKTTQANIKLLKLAGIDFANEDSHSEVVVIQDSQVVSNYPLPDIFEESNDARRNESRQDVSSIEGERA